MESKFILGTMRLELGNVEQGVELFKAAKEKGITYIDTADIYGNYQMNAHIGKILKEGSSFANFKIIGKTGICSPKDVRWETKHYNNSEDYLFEAVTKMCQDFGRDKIDTLLIHRPSPLTNFQQLAKSVKKLKDENLIDDFGVSNFNVDELHGLMQYTSVCENQIEMSPLNFENYYNNLLTFSQVRKLKLQFWSPMAGGNVFEEGTKISKVITKIASRYNVREDSVVYRFLLDFPVDAKIILGSTTPERLSKLDEVETFQLSEEEWFEIAQAGGKYIAK